MFSAITVLLEKQYYFSNVALIVLIVSFNIHYSFIHLSAHQSKITYNIHSILGCDASCDVGLGRCSNVGGDECCSVFFNGTCATQCPTINYIVDPITYECGEYCNTTHTCTCTLFYMYSCNL